MVVVVHFKADFGFWVCFVVLSVGVLEYKGVVNETFILYELLIMECIVCVMASLGTLNSTMPRWMDAEYERRVEGLVESLNTQNEMGMTSGFVLCYMPTMKKPVK